MAIHKLHIDELDETEFELIAIHSPLEDYRLAFMLNKALPILLHKCSEGIRMGGKDADAMFTRFEFEQAALDSRWTLIQNRFETEPVPTNDLQSLFADTDTAGSTQAYLLPELRKVDYFLKIENGGMTTEDIILIINQIDRVTAAYSVNYSKIRSRNNLIF